MSEREWRKVRVGILMFLGGIALIVFVMLMDNPEAFIDSTIGTVYLLVTVALILGGPVVIFMPLDD